MTDVGSGDPRIWTLPEPPLAAHEAACSHLVLVVAPVPASARAAGLGRLAHPILGSQHCNELVAATTLLAAPRLRVGSCACHWPSNSRHCGRSLILGTSNCCCRWMCCNCCRASRCTLAWSRAACSRHCGLSRVPRSAGIHSGESLLNCGPPWPSHGSPRPLLPARRSPSPHQ